MQDFLPQDIVLTFPTRTATRPPLTVQEYQMLASQMQKLEDLGKTLVVANEKTVIEDATKMIDAQNALTKTVIKLIEYLHIGAEVLPTGVQMTPSEALLLTVYEDGCILDKIINELLADIHQKKN